MSFAHLICHSGYSFMRGTASLAELAAGSAGLGQTALALTDVNGVYGAVWFWEAARSAGLKPILGADVRAGSERAVLLAKTEAGWERLCRLLTARHLEADFSLGRALGEDRAGLVTLCPDPALLEALRPGGDQDLYLALTPGADSRALLRLAHDRGVTPVATADVYMLRPADLDRQRLLRAIALNTTLSRVPRSELAHPEAWLAGEAEMARRFPSSPEAVANAGRVAESIELEAPPWRTRLFPEHEGLGEARAFRLLRSRCLAGARRRYGRITAAVRARLDHELAVIRSKGFATYFLVVEDIVRHFPITCGRGSAAASIVAYCLMITHVDPIRHNLFFERFLNPGRSDPPDIDVDFPWDDRDRTLAYVFEKYGDRDAAMVSNHVSLQPRAAAREVAKAFGLPEAEIGRVTRRLRGLWRVDDVEEMVRRHPAFKDLKLGPPWPRVFERAREIAGAPRHLSVHCGGVVIAPGRLSGRVPLERAPKGVKIIQWEKDQAEDAGLVKIDLLGNRSLAVVRDGLAALREHEGIELDYPDFNPIDDEAAEKALARGDTIGVFYVESPAMRQLQKKTGRGDFERLVVHSSIIRPAANDYIREYVRRLQGGAWAPLHPLVEGQLEESFGIMVYQEDVTRVAMALAGFDAAEGDGLRKVMSKKDRHKKLAAYREKFFGGARSRGVADDVIEKVWDMIMSFAGYSFCKPHSASYALVSYKSAWLRAHHPAEFMAAVISNRGGYYHAFAYVSEARRMGLLVLGPDANESEEAYVGRGKSLRVGLMQIKGLSRAGMEGLLSERKRGGPYRSFEDFLRRAQVAPGDAALLVKAGCFDGLEGEEARPGLLWRRWAHGRGEGGRPAALSLFDPPARELPRPAGYDRATLLRQEVETLGFLVSRHPLCLYEPFLKPRSWVAAADFEKWVGRRITALGWYVTGKIVETKHGEPMEFLSFEDTTGIYEATFFPEVYRRFCHLLERERPYLLGGRVDDDFGALSLSVDQVRLAPGGPEAGSDRGLGSRPAWSAGRAAE